MNLVKHRFEKDRITVDVIWCTEPGDDWLLTASKGRMLWTDVYTLPDEYENDIHIHDEDREALAARVAEIRRSEYEGLSSGPITEAGDEAL